MSTRKSRERRRGEGDKGDLIFSTGVLSIRRFPFATDPDGRSDAPEAWRPSRPRWSIATRREDSGLASSRSASLATEDPFVRANRRNGQSISMGPALRGSLRVNERWSRQKGRPPGRDFPARSQFDKTRTQRNDRSAPVWVWIERALGKKGWRHGTARNWRLQQKK